MNNGVKRVEIVQYFKTGNHSSQLHVYIKKAIYSYTLPGANYNIEFHIAKMLAVWVATLKVL